MANEITANVKIFSNIDEETVKAKRLKGALNDAAAAASTLPKGVAAAAASAPRGVAAAAAEGADYGVSRSAVGTGAAGRDFAQQAQGLGGLVHVYATFAANLFAAGAAFRALSMAADTTNMVKGLDQLGAASGMALGSMAKNLVKVTDSAISLKDAMSATAQATAGGLSGDQLTRLANVAKNASQALGRDMPDALSRLTRGIVKIEPELLDELGIMVRVDKAAQDYARTLGKSVTSLSAFEKRQSFANAVLAEGEQKFGNIKIDANPYSKLLASMTNVAITGLELVNTVLGPVIRLLGENPTALAAAMAGIATMMLSKAIPAISQWREGLKNAAAQAAASARSINNAYAEFQVEKFSGPSRVLQAKSDETAALAKNLITTKKLFGENSQIYQMSLSDDTRFTQDHANIVQGSLTKTANALAANKARIKGLKGSYEVDDVVTRNELQQQNVRLNQEKNHYTKLHEIVKNSVAQNVKAEEVGATELLAIEKNKGVAIESWARQHAADKAASRIASASALSAVGQNSQFMGLSSTLKELYKNTRDGIPAMEALYDTEGKLVRQATERTVALKGVAWAYTNAKGTALAFGSAAMSVASAITGWIQVIGLVVAGFQLFSGWLSTNSKEADKFSSSIDLVKSASEGAGRTFDLLNSKTGGSQFDSKNIQASANAVNEVSDSLKILSMDFQRVLDKSSNWDKFTNGFFEIFGKGRKATSIDAIAQSIDSTLKLLNGTEKDKAQEALTGLVGTSDFSIQGLTSSLEKMKLTDESLPAVLNNVSKGIEKISLEANNSAAKLADFNIAASTAGTEFAKLFQTLNSSDPFVKVGSGMVLMGVAMTGLTENTTNMLTALKEVVNNAERLKLLPADMQNKLLGKKEDINAKADEIDKLHKLSASFEVQQKQNIKDIEQNISTKITALQFGVLAFVQAYEKLTTGTVGTPTESAFAAAKRAADRKEESLKKQANEEYVTFWKEAADSAFLQGSELIATGLKNASETASLNLSKVLLGGISGVGAADAQYKLRLEEIAIQERIVTETKNLSEAMFISNTLANIRNVNDKIDKANAYGGDKSKLPELQKDLKVQEQIYTITSNKANRGALLSPKTGAEARAQYLPEAIAGSMAHVLQMSEADAKQTDINGQKKIASIQYQIALQNENYESIKKSLVAKQDTLKIQGDLLGVAMKSSPIFSEELATAARSNFFAQQEAATNTASHDRLKEISALELQISLAKKAHLSTTELEANKTDLTLKHTRQIAVETAKNNTDTLNFLRTEDTLRLASFKFIQDSLSKIADLEFAEATRKNSTLLSELDNKKALGFVSEESYIKEKLSLNQIAESLSKNNELRKLGEANIFANKGFDNRSADLARQKGMGTDTTAAEALLSQEKAVSTATFIANTSAIESNSAAKQASLALDAATAESLRQINDLLDTQKSLVESLAGAFGSVGASLGKAVEGLTRYGLEQDKIDNKYSNEKKKAKTLQDLQTLQEKYQNDSVKNELKGFADIAGGFKDMFGKKTAAYKIFEGIERTSHMFRMIMLAQEMAGDVMKFAARIGLIGTATAVEGASDATRAATKGPAVIMEYMSSIPAPWGAIAGAAAVAAVLGSLGGGSSNAPTFQMSSAQRQETQGTGQTYNSAGVKVDTGGGVFGDSAAKSKSIVNSLEILKNNSIEGLTYDNKMLQAMEKVANAVTGVGKSLISIPGLRQGTNFGTMESMSKAGGSFSGIPLVGGLLDSIFGGASSTTTSITDAGLMISGTLGDLAKDVTKGAQQFKDVRTITQTSGGWFGSDSTSDVTTRQFQELGKPAQEALQSLFTNTVDMFLTLADQVGLSATSVMDILNTLSIDVPISLKGLTGQALFDELNATIGAGIDSIATTVFAGIGFDAFRNVGEGFLETVVRVIDGNTKVGIALDYMGSKLDITANGVKKDSFIISEALINAAGGLAPLTDQIKFFGDHFLSEAERLAPQTKSLNKAFSDLGIATPLTRDAFKTLVQSTTDPVLLESLLKLAPAFDSIATASEKALESIGNSLDKLHGTNTNNKAALTTAANTTLQLVIDDASTNITSFADILNLSVADIAKFPAASQVLIANALSAGIALQDLTTSMQTTILNAITQINDRVQGMKFSMEMDTLSTADKYAKLDTKAAGLDVGMRDPKLTTVQAASKANELLDTVNSAWGLMDENQKKLALPAYLQKLDDINKFIQEKGLTDLVKLTPDGMAITTAIESSALLIIKALDPLGLKISDTTSAAISAVTSDNPQIQAMALALDFANRVMDPNNFAGGAPTEAQVSEEAAKAANLEAQRLENVRIAEASAAATTSLATGTQDLNATIASLQAIIANLVNVAKQPSNINVTVSAPKTVEVGIS